MSPIASVRAYATMEVVMEFFAAVGAPARLVGRLPLVTRYVWNGFSSPWPKDQYASDRFGKGYKWRPWLVFDAKELEMLDDLINTGSNEAIWAMRDSQLSACHMAAVIGALVAQAAITALQLPQLQDTHYTARGFLSISLVVSLLAVFFAWLQQRMYGFMDNAAAMRAWLSNGVRHAHASERRGWQSSSLSHQALQVPFELVSIAITLFFAGIGVYLGSAMVMDLDLGTGGFPRQGDQAIFIAFVVTTLFVTSLFGQLVGGKDIERAKCSQEELAKIFEFGPSRNHRNVVPGPVPHSPFQPATTSRPMTERTVKGPSGGATEIPKEELTVALQKVVEAHQACAAASSELASLYLQFQAKEKA